MASSDSSDNPCDLYNLHGMPDGTTCTAKWSKVRDVLHPAQEAVGYAAVQRKIHKDYTSKKKAQKRMDEPGSMLPFVLGPGGVPYLIDSHHTASALEASGYHKVKVTLKKICDWSSMAPAEFYSHMMQENFMMGLGRPSGDANDLPVPVDVAKAIPSTIPELKNDPWRSLAALVRKVKDDSCPPEHDKCLRGYIRECRPKDNTMTPFFEFRWSYFFNQAYQQGCADGKSLWEDSSDCIKFQTLYQSLRKENDAPIADQDRKAWQEAAKLLVPLCRGPLAQSYILPSGLGAPMGGEPLPGRVAGKTTPILRDDPSCQAPNCPVLPVMPATASNKTTSASTLAPTSNKSNTSNASTSPTTP